MKFSLRIRFGLRSFLVATFWIGVPLSSGQVSAPQTTIARDSHALIEFWANHNWSSRTLSGTLAEPDAPQRTIPGAKVSLWRFEGGERLPDGEWARVSLLDLQSFRDFVRQEDGRVKLYEVASTQTSSSGEFSFANLRAGIYSLQFDWTSLAGRDLVEVTEQRPRHLHSSLAAFVLTHGYQPPAQ